MMSMTFNTGDTFIDIFLDKLMNATVELELMFVGPEDKTFYADQMAEIVAKTHQVRDAREALYSFIKDTPNVSNDTPDVRKVLDHVSAVLFRVSGKYL